MYKTEREKAVSVNSQMQHSVLFNSLCFPNMNAKQLNFLTLFFYKTGGKLEKGKNGGKCSVLDLGCMQVWKNL